MEKQKIVKKKVKRIGITLKEQPLHSGLREINTETCPHLQQRARPCWRGTAMVHWMAEKLQWCLKVLRKAVYKEVPHWGHARGGWPEELLAVDCCWLLGTAGAATATGAHAGGSCAHLVHTKMSRQHCLSCDLSWQSLTLCHLAKKEYLKGPDPLPEQALGEFEAVAIK